jgi:hypothetical protein
MVGLVGAPEPVPPHLQRLIRKGLLERAPGSNRYQLAALGRGLVLFAARLHRRGLARLEPDCPAGQLNQASRGFDTQLGALLSEARLAAWSSRPILGLFVGVIAVEGPRQNNVAVHSGSVGLSV